MYYGAWENFRVGKNWRVWQIECLSSIFTLQMLPFVISCSYTYMQLIHQYFTCQLVHISSLTNILPLPTYGIYVTIAKFSWEDFHGTLEYHKSLAQQIFYLQYSMSYTVSNNTL